MSTLTQTKNILLANCEKRYQMAKSSYDSYPCLESLERLETAASVVVKIRKQYGVDVDAELADTIDRAARRMAYRAEEWTSPSNQFYSDLEGFDAFMRAAIGLVGVLLVIGTVYGLTQLFE